MAPYVTEDVGPVLGYWWITGVVFGASMPAVVPDCPLGMVPDSALEMIF